MQKPESTNPTETQVCQPGDDDTSRALAKTLQMEVETRADESSPLFSSRFFATARAVTEAEIFYGDGAGLSAQAARHRAVMECAERYAQFGCLNPPSAAIGSYAALAGDAINPNACGLYSGAQYAGPDFAPAPFTDEESLEWLEVTNLATGKPALLPVEFIYPRARLPRRPLVAETSSGSAAHTERDAAVLAALCEVVERDGLMLF